MNKVDMSKVKAACLIEKTLSSAVAKLMNTADSEDVSVDNIYVKECYADGAPHLKRFRPASMGRISRINKKTSHLTIVVSTNIK